MNKPKESLNAFDMALRIEPKNMASLFGKGTNILRNLKLNV